MKARLHRDPSGDKREPFESPKLKVERAKHHVRDYRAAFKAFSESNIIRVRPETDAQAGDWFKIWLSEPMPSDLRLTAADALYNLRSALDQAVCCSAVLAHKSPDGTYFPHGKDKAGFEISLGQNARKFPDSSVELLPIWSHTTEGTVICSASCITSIWSINTPT